MQICQTCMLLFLSGTRPIAYQAAIVIKQPITSSRLWNHHHKALGIYLWGDSVLLTERGYLLPSANASPAPMPTAYFSGAAAAFLESPYVLFATPNSMIAKPEMLKGLQH